MSINKQQLRTRFNGSKRFDAQQLENRKDVWIAMRPDQTTLKISLLGTLHNPDLLRSSIPINEKLESCNSCTYEIRSEGRNNSSRYYVYYHWHSLQDTFFRRLCDTTLSFVLRLWEELITSSVSLSLSILRYARLIFHLDAVSVWLASISVPVTSSSWLLSDCLTVAHRRLAFRRIVAEFSPLTPCHSYPCF